MRQKIKTLLALLVLMVGIAAVAQAKPDEILEKNLEQQYAHESDTLKIDIDQWHYAYKKHDLRFFVAHIYVSDPAQLRTAFAREEYNKTYAEATSDIAARHDAVLAITIIIRTTWGSSSATACSIAIRRARAIICL